MLYLSVTLLKFMLKGQYHHDQQGMESMIEK